MILVGDIVPLDSRFESPDFGDEIALGNLEGPVCRTGLRPIDKVGPCLHSKPFQLKGKWAFALANNHIMDFRREGLDETIGFLKSGIIDCAGYCGAGYNIDEARRSLIVEDKGLKVAIISCCERQFGVAETSKCGVAAYGAWVDAAIRDANNSADRVIVSCHAGSELSTAVSPRLRNLYHHWIDVGADVIHGHHSHVPQGVEEYCGKPIFYGLGNFIVDKTHWRCNPDACWSLVVRLDLSDELPKWRIESSGTEPSNWQTHLKEISRIFLDERLLISRWEENCKWQYPRYYRPYVRMGIKSLVRWLVYPKRQHLLMECFKNCETHHDILETINNLGRRKMIKHKIYRWIMRHRITAAAGVASFRARYKTRQDIEHYQVERFNAIWKSAYESVSFYRKRKSEFSLPDRIMDLKELESWPVLTKADLRETAEFVREDGLVATRMLVTGGSTGEPTRILACEDPTASISQILGRKSYGIEIGDRTFLLWGHEHLYGTGLVRKVNALKRRFKDWLADWQRVSAYDLSATAMHKAYGVFAKFRPEFVIGFSPAVLSFVRHNRDKAGVVRSVRVVLCTAGPLTPKEKCEIEGFFGGIVCMEYGSVECAIMAYTRPQDGKYNVFWNTHLLQAQKQSDGEFKNLVTRLTDSYVPLIRYDIGDYLDLDPEMEEANACSVLEIRLVKGRPSEMINFKCGVSFFGALIGDCVKQVPEVVSSQIAIDEDNNKLEIRVTSAVALNDAQMSLIKNRFYLTVENARKLDVKVVQVEKLFTTVGGKIPRVVR